MDHIGIDVYRDQSLICILTEEGEWIQHRVRTERKRFEELVEE